MALLSITRNQFIDRTMDFRELAELTEMLRHWYVSRSGAWAREAQVLVEAIAYAFPQPMTDEIRRSLSAKLPGVTFDTSDPDELLIAAPAVNAEEATELSVWREVLAETLLAHACVRLRWSVRGLMSGFDGMSGEGESTFVLCGMPANGAMLLKAMWHHGKDPSLARVYRHVAWDEQDKLLEVFDGYLAHRARVPAEAAATLASNHFGERSKFLFMAARDERKVMWLIRHRVELPDDRSPLRMLRRMALPLVAGAILAAMPSMLADTPLLVVIFLYAAAAYMLYAVSRIVWQKADRVISYRRAMRRGLGKLYSEPIEPIAADLSQDHTPTLLKYSAEMESLGAKRICDSTLKRAGIVIGSNQRYFHLGDTEIALGLLRQTESLMNFPPQPIFFLNTRFTDGRRHFTTNSPIYRKRTRLEVSGRCLVDGSVAEVWALHRQEVDQLIAQGAIPIAPPATMEQVFERMRLDHEESRAMWQKRPYSWGDAFHDAFKIVRREYRPR